MSLTFERLVGAEVADVIDDLARLRIAVFREWPYLYDGSLDYEQRYLQGYAKSGSVVVTARGQGCIVGAATGAPLVTHAEAFANAFAGSGLELETIFYFAESVMLPEWRGLGAGHAFFDHREAHARAAGFSRAAFCTVIRPDDHPARPPDYRPLDPFWRARGYAPLPGVVACFEWRDLDQARQTGKPLQFWMRDL
jgi:GNAT superfamily N-acetyltransferase